MVALESTANILEDEVWLEDSTTIAPTLTNVFGSQTTLIIDHPGYFGKVGMRYFHERKVWKSTLNLDKLWTIVPDEVREKFLGKQNETAPVIDTLALVMNSGIKLIVGIYKSAWKGTTS
jgi:hypothetical protein